MTLGNIRHEVGRGKSVIGIGSTVNAAIVIVAALPADLPEIETLLDAGFGPARRNRTAYRLRDRLVPDPALSFTARDGGRLVGSVQCWNIRLQTGSQAVPLTLLGPVAAAADCRGQGIGSALVRAALTAIDATIGTVPVLLIGDAPFYGRFGFSAAATAGWTLPGPIDPARVLLRGGSDLPRLGRVEAGAAARCAA